MEYLKSLLLGITEGITEWLPVSSTGHLIILNSFLDLDASPSFLSMFDVVIQLGAILAVVIVLFPILWPFAHRADNGGKLWKRDTLSLWGKIIVSCIPCALLIPFQDRFEELFYNPLSVSMALIVFGIAFILVERWNRNRAPSTVELSGLGVKTALYIGLFQVLSMVFPGTSRSGATIIGALILGVERSVAAEFTFSMALPVMAGASLIKLLKFGFAFSSYELTLLSIGCLSAFVTSLVTIRFLLAFVKKHDFSFFGWYRIALGLMVIIFTLCH